MPKPTQAYRYQLTFGQKHRMGKVTVTIEKETSNLEPIKFSKEEAENALKEIGLFMYAKADFETLKKVG